MLAIFFKKYALKPPAKKGQKNIDSPAIPAKAHMIHPTFPARSEKIDPASEFVCVQLVYIPP
jgi:hypothetical protein